MDYTYDEVMQALRNADAAGDAVAARRLAQIANDMQTPSLTAGEVATQAITNFPSSFGGLVSDLATAVTSPLETGKAVLDLGAGILQNILPERMVQAIGEDPQSREVASRIGQFYADRYGSVDGAKQAIAQDPAGVLADAATVLFTGGALTPGRVGATATKAATVIDPINIAAKSVAATGRGAGKVLAPALGVQTGAGTEPIKQAYRAGREGGEIGEMFRANLEGRVPATDVLESAKQSLSTIRQQKSQDYRSGMMDISKDQTVLSFDGIDQALKNVSESVMFKGRKKQRTAAQKLSEVRKEISDWKKLDPTEYHTPEGLDALKQVVGDILEGIPLESQSARYAVGEVYKSIKNEITKQAPSYAKVMKGYEEASAQIKEVEKALSLGKKASVDTAMRKLQSLMRDNVQTNYGQRIALAKKLEEAGGREIMPALAGQALSDLAPRGLQRSTALPAGGLAYLIGGVPAAGLSLASSSPRLMGEAAYVAGAARRGAGAAAQKAPFIVNPALYNLLYQSGRIPGLLEQ
jgi:hypothetical protein